jgi:hypothetical protein
MQNLSKTLINRLNQIIKDTASSKTGKTLKNNRLLNNQPKNKRINRRHTLIPS